MKGIGKESVGSITCWETLMQSVIWNSSARVEKEKIDKKETGKYITAGNVTEQGIFKFFSNGDLKSLLDFKDTLTEENTLCTIPFTRESKRGSIIVRNPNLAGTSHEVRVYCKGAPDFFLEKMESTGDMSYPELTSV